jgi:hypothetical protein
MRDSELETQRPKRDSELETQSAKNLELTAHEAENAEVKKLEIQSPKNLELTVHEAENTELKEQLMRKEAKGRGDCQETGAADSGNGREEKTEAHLGDERDGYGTAASDSTLCHHLSLYFSLSLSLALLSCPGYCPSASISAL